MFSAVFSFALRQEELQANLSGSTVNLTNPAVVNGKSVVSGTLGSFKVTDLRQVSKPGWNLQTSVTDFTKGTDTIAASALGSPQTPTSPRKAA